MTFLGGILQFVPFGRDSFNGVRNGVLFGPRAQSRYHKTGREMLKRACALARPPKMAVLHDCLSSDSKNVKVIRLFV
jgi:hypothetical protein